MPPTSDDMRKIIACLNAGDWSLMAEKAAASDKKTTLGDFSGCRVLAVDDNPINREVLKEALNALNIKARFATDGQSAVDIAHSQEFDIIFMDCSMPGMDGYEATAAIRANGLNAGTHIVALTAHVTGEAATRWQAAGMDSYMAKPFTVTQLRQAITAVYRPSAAPETLSSNTDHSAHDAAEALELLSPDVLSMFAMVMENTGTDIRTKVFSMFIGQVDQAVQALEVHVAQNTDNRDFKAVKDLAHALKSMCSSAGAQAAAKICDEIEVDAQKNVFVTGLQMNNLREIIAQTKHAMQRLINEKAQKVA
ncbi:MAG: response regulator [Ahrensia sp.]|nr:response regulator [Ahrensia sp.]